MLGGKGQAALGVASKVAPKGGFLGRMQNFTKNATQRAVGINVARRSLFKGAGTGGVVEATARDTLAGLQGAAAGALTKDIIAGGGQIQKAAVRQQAIARKATKQFLAAKKVASKVPKAASLSAMKFDMGVEKDATEKSRVAPRYANKNGVEFLRVSRELNRAMGNAGATRRSIANSYEAVKYINARTYDKLIDKSFSQMAWLQGQLPQNPGIGTATNGFSDWVPTDEEITKFERKAAVVRNPMVAIERLKQGSITLDEVQALRAAWPEMYQDIVMTVAENMDSLQDELSYDRRVALSIFTGVPVDSTMRRTFIASIQGMYAKEREPEPKQSTQSFRPDKIGKEAVESNTTAAQRIAQKR
jgi:hypothetical protein